jgi:adenylate cyclase
VCYPSQDLKRKLLIGCLLGLAAATLAAVIALLPFVETVEMKTYDLRVRATSDPTLARKDIVLVGIDDTSIGRLEPLVGRWPWPRVIHASLIDYLARAPARVVAYDVLFTERDRRSGFAMGDQTLTGEESDRALADSVAQAGNVVMLTDVTFGGLEKGPAPIVPATVPKPPYGLDESFEERPVIVPPYAELASASRALGHNYFVLDEDGPLRRTVPFVRVGDRFVPSLNLAAGLIAAGVSPEQTRVDGADLRLGDRRMPLVAMNVPGFAGQAGQTHRSRRFLIRFTGPALLEDGKTPTYRTYSFYDLFYSEQQLLAGERPFIDPSVFRDKIVIVGTTAAGLHDIFSVPLGSTGKMAGNQIHANVIDDVLSSRFIRRLGWGAVAGATVGCGLTVALVSVFSGAWATVFTALATAALLGWGSVMLFDRGLWLGVVQPAGALGLAVFGGVAYQYFVEGQEKRKVKRLFSRYVAPDVYSQLLADPTRARLGGQRREMSVLFSDIRGFTTVSERGQPEEIVAQLNEYFSRMVAVLFEHRGTLDKFVGDMVMALFGAPVDDEWHADHAVAAALDMLRELKELNRRWTAEGRPTLEIGIGINSGPMIAGNIGSEAIMSYTVIGDAVNLGSRLESLNKQYGTRIIISEHTRRRLRNSYDVHPLGEVVVKGKSQAVAIFEVRTDPGISPTTGA